MNEVIIKQSNWNMIYLIACVMHGKVAAADKVQSMDLSSLYLTAKVHTLTAITAMALESTEAFQTAAPELTRKWKQEKEKAIRKNILLDAEREEIFQYMEAEGIWYMPLKGSILQDWYPKYGMRQMADNDILYDGSYQKQMLQFMQERGYQAESVGKIHHDIYEKPPVYNFELHTALFGKLHNPIWQEYYKDVKDRLIKDEDNAYGWHFSDEDFYIYLITHAFKHYNGSGTGLRTLLDIYVYNLKKGTILDREYIKQELKKLEIQKFEEQCRKLSEKLFDDPTHFFELQLSDEEQEMLAFFGESGTYGTLKNQVNKKLKELQSDGKPISKKTKWKYYMKRLFPDMQYFETYVPFCYRHKWAIPFFDVFRLFRAILFKRKKMRGEIEALKMPKK